MATHKLIKLAEDRYKCEHCNHLFYGHVDRDEIETKECTMGRGIRFTVKVPSDVLMYLTVNSDDPEEKGKRLLERWEKDNDQT
jgi:hypothetical protein